MTDKPLLLVDIDGVLNPWPMLQGREAPDGWERHQLFPPGYSQGLWVILNKAHGAELLKLTDLFELTWATSWEHHANTFIGPLIGLPELPVIEMPRGSTPFGQIWKRGYVAEYAGDRDFAWLDDDFQQMDFTWAARRDRSGARTKLVGTSPEAGVQDFHFRSLEVWAERIRRPQ